MALQDHPAMLPLYLLSHSYMGLTLRNPLVASASPLSHTVEGVQRLAEAGVGAVVLFSLFEEQLREQAVRTARLVDEPAESFAEALDYLPAVAKALAREAIWTCSSAPRSRSKSP